MTWFLEHLPSLTDCSGSVLSQLLGSICLSPTYARLHARLYDDSDEEEGLCVQRALRICSVADPMNKPILTYQWVSNVFRHMWAPLHLANLLNFWSSWVGFRQRDRLVEMFFACKPKVYTILYTRLLEGIYPLDETRSHICHVLLQIQQGTLWLAHSRCSVNICSDSKWTWLHYLELCCSVW